MEKLDLEAIEAWFNETRRGWETRMQGERLIAAVRERDAEIERLRALLAPVEAAAVAWMDGKGVGRLVDAGLLVLARFKPPAHATLPAMTSDHPPKPVVPAPKPAPDAPRDEPTDPPPPPPPGKP